MARIIGEPFFFFLLFWFILKGGRGKEKMFHNEVLVK